MDNGTVQQIVTTTPIRIDLCNNFYKDEDIIENNLRVPLDLFYCTEPNATSIMGNWGAPTYVNLRVEFKKCHNTTMNKNHCKSPQEIDEVIQNGYLSLDFTNYNVNPKNFTQPLTRMWLNEYNLLNANSSLEYSINLLPMMFYSDSGLLFEDNKIFRGLYYDMRIFNRNTPSDYICSFNFQGNTGATVYLRSYVKIQTVLTQIGGFIKALMLAGYVISTLFSKNHYLISYLQEIASIEETNQNLNENIKNKNHGVSSNVNIIQNSCVQLKNQMMFNQRIFPIDTNKIQKKENFNFEVNNEATQNFHNLNNPNMDKEQSNSDKVLINST